MKILTLLILSLLILTGCCTPTIEVVHEVKTVYVDIPKLYLIPCGMTIPPTTKEYIYLGAIKKEEILADYIGSLLNDLATCNLQIKELSKWDSKQAEVYRPKEKGN